MRVTRNADIDADALYDEDLDDTIVKALCNYLDLDTRQVFCSFAPLGSVFCVPASGLSPYETGVQKQVRKPI